MAEQPLNSMAERIRAAKEKREKQQIEQALQGLLGACSGATGALVATGDGFVVVEVFKNMMAGSTLAAISSSLISLAESMAKETSSGLCNNVIIEAEEGTIVSLRITPIRVLTVIAEKKTRLGMLLSAAKICVDQLAGVLANAS